MDLYESGKRIVTNQDYSSEILYSDIRDLQNRYPFLEVGEIGKTVLGKSIPYIKIGSGNREVFYSAAIHANEWITAPVLMKFLDDYAMSYSNNELIFGYNARAIFNSTTLYVVPMINLDGVDLVTGSIQVGDNEYEKARIIVNSFPQIPFPSGWKANINGVDLNLQFPAGWENAREIKYAQGFDRPAPRDFVGYGPLTEPEVLAVYNFTLEHNFRLILAYHTQGEEIYWQFLNYNPPRAYDIGVSFSIASGYELASVPYNSSFAGYKDWFIQQYNRPGYTIEAGLGQNPLPITQFGDIYQRNVGILTLGLVLN